MIALCTHNEATLNEDLESSLLNLSAAECPTSKDMTIVLNLFEVKVLVWCRLQAATRYTRKKTKRDLQG